MEPQEDDQGPAYGPCQTAQSTPLEAPSCCRRGINSIDLLNNKLDNIRPTLLYFYL